MEPEDTYEYDYDDSGGRVLWGRFAFWGAALLLAFVVGRCSAPGPTAEELQAARQEAQEYEERNNDLRQEIEALTEGQTPQTDEPANEEPDGDAEIDDSDTADSTDAPAGSQTYTVQPRDTLRSIAQKFYGDPEKHELISEANGIDGDNLLQVGQKLEIPPDPEADA